MKTTKRKLSLSKDTLKQLSNRELGEVNAANTTLGCSIGCPPTGTTTQNWQTKIVQYCDPQLPHF